MGFGISGRGRGIILASLYLLSLAAAACTSVVRQRLDPPKLVSDGTGYQFYYDDISVSEVHLAGDFNRWGPNDNGQIRRGDKFNIPFTRREDGIWIATVPYKEHVKDPRYDHLDDDVYLEHGRQYRYKIVIDGGSVPWRLDPLNKSIETEPGGNENSILVAP